VTPEKTRDVNGQLAYMRAMTLMIGIGISILIAGIPWAYTIHGRLASIESRLDAIKSPPDWLRDLVRNNTMGRRDHEKRIGKLEGRLP